MSEETVTWNLDINVTQAQSELRKVEFLLFRTLGILNRLGLPEDIQKGIAELQRLIMIVRLTHTALIALQTASGPIGWAMAGLSVATLTISAAEEFRYDETRGT